MPFFSFWRSVVLFCSFLVFLMFFSLSGAAAVPDTWFEQNLFDDVVEMEDDAEQVAASRSNAQVRLEKSVSFSVCEVGNDKPWRQSGVSPLMCVWVGGCGVVFLLLSLAETGQ
jgi:hypothetical protein